MRGQVQQQAVHAAQEAGRQWGTRERWPPGGAFGSVSAGLLDAESQQNRRNGRAAGWSLGKGRQLVVTGLSEAADGKGGSARGVQLDGKAEEEERILISEVRGSTSSC